MTTSELLLAVLTLVFALPYLAWRLLGTESFAPLVVVQIVAGILLGPGVLGHLLPDFHAALFTQPVIGALGGIALWAVTIFVFLAGLELELHEVWAHRGETILTAALALILPLAFGSLAGIVMLAIPGGWQGPAARPWQFVLGIGMSCAVTALPILIVLMERLGILRMPFGRRVLRFASLDDLAIWAILALILLDWQRLGRQALFFVLFAGFALVMRRLIKALPARDRWPAALIWLLLCGLSADWAGLHYMVGAFLAGAVLDARVFGQEQVDRLRDHVLMGFMPVFFLSTGLRTAWAPGGLAVFAVAGLLLLAAVVGKLAGVRIAGRLLGWPKGEAAVIGWLLQTKALIMIIFANVLLERQIISDATFTALLLMAVASTVLTIPVASPGLRRLGLPTGYGWDHPES